MIFADNNHEQRGDTIIEVLLAMAVVGLVLGSSFGIANRSLQIGQSAKERTTALKLAESQIEKLKTLKGTTELTNLSPTSTFCISTDTLIDIVQTSVTAPNSKCTNINDNGAPGLYTVIIKPPATVPGSTSAYTIDITWLRLGAPKNTDNANVESLTLYYKLGVL